MGAQHKGRYKNPVLNKLDGLSAAEQVEFVKSNPNGFGFYDIVDIFDKPYQKVGPYGNTQTQYIGSQWFHIMPNYEYCSKDQPILPIFDNDTEKTIYLFVMTNAPLDGNNLEVELYKSRGGKFTSISLFSKNEPERSLTLMREGYVNPQLLQDMANYKIKVIQMSAIVDFFSVIKNATQIAYGPMRYQSGIDYDNALKNDGIVSPEQDSWQSGQFLSMFSFEMSAGFKNYPLLQFLDPDKWGLHAIKCNLDILLNADKSRIHQLPLPIGMISCSNTTLWHVDKEYAELTEFGLSDKFKSFFWPRSISTKFPPECFRAPEMGMNYPGISLLNYIR